MTRRRADVVLAERGFYPSRERARAAILAGEVRVDGQALAKAGALIDEDADVTVIERPRYVSRGGVKLEGALETFGVDPSGCRAVDVGASTGGFTDCMLQHGATHVTAIDVGYGQIAWSLRQDERVTVIERTNIRDVDPTLVGEPFDLAVVDVSFISLRTVMPHVASLMGSGSHLLALVKPQFEVGKGRVGKKGVVRDPHLHAEVLGNVIEGVHAEGFVMRGLAWSPVKGPQGNIEFWVWASRQGDEAHIDIETVVERAHFALGE